MTGGPWFRRDAGRLQREYEALEAAGLRYEVDAAAGDQGVLRLHVTLSDGDRDVQITATYPDEFPYFKPVVTGPDVKLGNHYNPASGEYCLLESGKGVWRPSDTLAMLLTTQWQLLLSSRTSAVDDQGELIEVPQAEPLSAYVTTDPTGVVVLDGRLRPPTGVNSGMARIRVSQPSPLRAFVESFADGGGEVAGPIDVPVDERADVERVRWVRLDETPWDVAPDSWWSAACTAEPAIERGWRREHGSKALVCTVLVGFPEEVAHQETGDGWLLLVRRKVRPAGAPGPVTAYRVRRAGHDDLFDREPSLRAMRECSLLLVGLGGLGSQIGALLASTAPAEVRLWDGDAVEPETAVRVLGAFETAGQPKTHAVARLIRSTQPYTNLACYSARIGAPRLEPQGVPDVASLLRDAVGGTELVLDASADLSVQHRLSDLCREQGVAYLRAEALPGVWSGLVALQRPDAAVCWMCWQHHLEDGGLPALPKSTQDFIQPPGCAEPTYTGAGFDLAIIAAQAVRTAVGYLTGDDGYGEIGADVLTVRLRSEAGVPVPPTWQAHNLERHPSCRNHR